MAEDAAAPPTDPIDAGVEGLRTTAKWMAASYAAIGAALIAGTQLSDFGQVADEEIRVVGAALAAVGALVTIVMAVYQTAKVLAPSVVDLGTVIQDEEKYPIGQLVKRDPTLLEGHGHSIREVYESYNAKVAEYNARWEQYAAETDKTKKAALAEEVREIEGDRDVLNDTLKYLRKVALFLAVKDAFNKAAKWWFGAAVAAALGLVLFAYATNPGEDAKSKAPTLETPARVDVTLTDTKAEGLRDALGSKCSLRKVDALALAGSTKAGYDVVTVPADGCSPVRLNLGAEYVTPAATVDVSAPRPKEKKPGTTKDP